MITKHVLEILGTLESASTGIILTNYFQKSRDKVKFNWQPADLDRAEKYKQKSLVKLSKLLSYMKKKGLVDNSGDRNKSVWLITQVGRERLEFIKSRDFITNPFESLDKLKKGELKVIVFDIPELERKKRDWLRISLMNLGFEMLQKSVWVGNTDLPEEFILSLNNLEILSYLHMFIIKERGTIGLKGFIV